MTVFTKKVKPVDNLAMVAIFTAINALFILLCNFVPPLVFALPVILPINAAIIGYFCLKPYYFVFLCSTILICSFINLSDSLIFLISSLVSGLIFGFFIDKKINKNFLMIISIFSIALITLLSYKIFYIIFSIDILDELIVILNISNLDSVRMFKIIIIFSISLFETCLSYFFIIAFMKRLKINLINPTNFLLVNISSLVFCLICIAVSFVDFQIGICFIPLTFILQFETFVKNITRLKLSYLLSICIAFVVFLFIFAGLYSALQAKTFAFLILIPYVSALYNLITNRLYIKHNAVKINSYEK